MSGDLHWVFAITTMIALSVAMAGLWVLTGRH